MEAENDIDFGFEQEKQEPFSVTDDGKAEFALRKIAEEQGETNRLVMICKAEASKYEGKARDYQERQDKRTAYLKMLLRQYFETVPHKKTKTQEIYELPSGKLKMKTKEPEYIKDDKTLTEYLKKNGFLDFVEVVEKPKWGEFKKTTQLFRGKNGTWLIDQDGNVVECVKVEEREPEFAVEV